MLWYGQSKTVAVWYLLLSFPKSCYYYTTISLFTVKVKISSLSICISPNKSFGRTFFIWLETMRLLFNNSNYLGRLKVKFNQLSNQICLPPMKWGLFQTLFAFGPFTKCHFWDITYYYFHTPKTLTLSSFFWKGFHLWIDLNL